MMARHFLVATVLALGLLSAAFGQPATKVYRVGWLGYTAYNTPEDDRNIAAFRQRLRELGFVEGTNLVIEWRYAEGHNERAMRTLPPNWYASRPTPWSRAAAPPRAP